MKDLVLSKCGISEEVFSTLADRGVTWNFIPPGSPHFGGLWEAGVKSMKHHLKRILGESKLTFEEVSTVLVQIEACLNSRPLCALTDDPEDTTALTPGHFLSGRTLLAPPEPDILDINTHRLDRWRILQQLQQQFWRAWSTEYLSRLQQRPKWAMVQENVEIGNLVLVKDERLPSTCWMLGRVSNLYPGSDGLVRVVELKSNGKFIKRPVTKICMLPIRDNFKENKQ